ncbi:hypothetical protein GJ496_001516 [Pomphorhynchus laevis]|nr:hypothetical protein GJ496_001516 [Pomphorhynchus laevis]
MDDTLDYVQLHGKRGVLVLTKYKNAFENNKEQASNESLVELNRRNVENHIISVKRDSDESRRSGSDRADAAVNNRSDFSRNSAINAWRQKNHIPRYKTTIMESIQEKLGVCPAIYTPVKLVDQVHSWISDMAKLLDKNQQVGSVVGVIGNVSVGKSTILSLIAGNNFQDKRRDMIFIPCSNRNHNIIHSTTTGIESFICLERTILLDSEGIFPFEADLCMEHKDQYKRAQKDLKIITFMITTCTDILVVVNSESDLSKWKSIISTALVLRNKFIEELLPFLDDKFKTKVSTDLKMSYPKRPRITYCINRYEERDFTINDDVLNEEQIIKLPNCDKESGESISSFQRLVERLRQRFIRKEFLWPKNFSESQCDLDSR